MRKPYLKCIVATLLLCVSAVLPTTAQTKGNGDLTRENLRDSLRQPWKRCRSTPIRST